MMAGASVLLVHPARYEFLKSYLAGEAAAVTNAPCGFAAIQVRQHPYVPLTTTVRRRVVRICRRGQRRRWYEPRKYVTRQVEVLGWWLNADLSREAVTIGTRAAALFSDGYEAVPHGA